MFSDLCECWLTDFNEDLQNPIFRMALHAFGWIDAIKLMC